MNGARSFTQVIVECGEQTLDAALTNTLSQVRVLQRLSLPTLCELTFEFNTTAINTDVFAAGCPLRVRTDAHTTLFDGEITALRQVCAANQRRSFCVRAYDRLHRLRKRQSLRSFADVTAVELARELVSDLGLSVEAQDEGPIWPRIVQWQQTDLALLDEIARRAGLYFVLRGDVLQLVSAAGDGEPIPLELGTSLIEAEFDVSLEPACREMSVRGWSPWHAEAIDARSTTARSERAQPAPLDPEVFELNAHRELPNEVAHDSAQAQSIAQAELDRRRAGEVIAQGVARGDPALCPGAVVEVSGHVGNFGGHYALVAVTHSIDRSRGFRSRFDTTPLANLPKPRGTITTLGEVIDADDPDGLGRVRLSLPTFGAIETDWLEVLTAGAGSGKGLISLPDQGDRVLVLLPRHDPAHGVVLGGLFGREAPPDSGVVDGHVQRFTFLTPGGQRLCLDDDQRSVTLETGGGNRVELTPSRVRMADSRGSFIEMSDDAVRLSAERTLELIARGQSIRICGSSVDFERA